MAGFRAETPLGATIAARLTKKGVTCDNEGGLSRYLFHFETATALATVRACRIALGAYGVPAFQTSVECRKSRIGFAALHTLQEFRHDIFLL
jgi:hypothetical protein